MQLWKRMWKQGVGIEEVCYILKQQQQQQNVLRPRERTWPNVIFKNVNCESSLTPHTKLVLYIYECTS